MNADPKQDSAADRLDPVVDMLANLICADAKVNEGERIGRPTSGKLEHALVDVGSLLPFRPMLPKTAFTSAFTLGGIDRLFTFNSDYLVNSVQDLLGSEAEIALVAEDRIKWVGLRKLNKAPRNYWVGARGASLYELHFREVFDTGASNYTKSVCAVSQAGKPVHCIYQGSGAKGGPPDGMQAVLAASIIEDAMRKDVFRATLRDTVGIVLPVQQGAHLELFRLRDGPCTGSRRRPLLHWVSKHLRRSVAAPSEVKAHLRGVHTFEMDGISVQLESSE